MKQATYQDIEVGLQLDGGTRVIVRGVVDHVGYGVTTESCPILTTERARQLANTVPAKAKGYDVEIRPYLYGYTWSVHYCGTRVTDGAADSHRKALKVIRKVIKAHAKQWPTVRIHVPA